MAAGVPKSVLLSYSVLSHMLLLMRSTLGEENELVHDFTLALSYIGKFLREVSGLSDVEFAQECSDILAGYLGEDTISVPEMMEKLARMQPQVH